MTDVLALDIATVTGFARGKVGGMPVSGRIAFGDYKASGDEVFAAALQWITDLLARAPVPDLLLVEQMLPPTAMRNATSRAVRDRLAGLHGIIRAAAARAKVPEIAAPTVGDVRDHFIGARNAKRGEAKLATIRMCQMQGWPVIDDNAADALALWSYGCALIKPQTALRVTPLFNRPWVDMWKVPLDESRRDRKR